MKLSSFSENKGSLYKRLIGTGLATVFTVGTVVSCASETAINKLVDGLHPNIGRLCLDNSPVTVDDLVLRDYVISQYEQLNKVFPGMREVLKSVLKLSERQISDLEENDLIPEKKDFIFSYLKQINFDPKCKWSGGFCKCEDEFSDFEYNAIGSRNFNSIARVALFKISPKFRKLYNQLIKTHVCLAYSIVVLVVVFCLILIGIAKQMSGIDRCKKSQGEPDSLGLAANLSKIAGPAVSYDSQPTTDNSGFGCNDPFVATLVGSAFPTAPVGDFGLRKWFSQDKVGKLKAQVNNKSDSSYDFTYIGSSSSKVLKAKVKDSESSTKEVYQR